MKLNGRRKQHVMIFRHCVRSTSSTVKLYTNSSEKSTPITDFTASPLPNWNVPDEWCTKEALKTIKRTGKYLMNNILNEKNNNYAGTDEPIKIHFDIVSDTAYRDVDTSFALSLGIKEALNDLHDKIEATGISNLRLDDVLFKPIKSLTKTSDGDIFNEPICSSSFSPKRKIQEINKKLRELPKPTTNLNDAITILENRGGIGISGSLKSLSRNSELNLYHDGNLQGSINVVKLMAQMMFYSRAGGIKPPFLPKATVNEVYTLLAWAEYVRNVISTDNVKAALKGAILADSVIRNLREDIDPTKHSYDEKVTILVGHDTNMDSIATAMGLRWSIPPPFYQGDHGEYLATPPGSAMYFTNDLDSNVVKMSYLFPIMVSGKGKSFHYNNTGILESIPMIFREDENEEHNYNFSYDETSSFISSFRDNKTGVDILFDRTASVLRIYPEASECFLNATKNVKQGADVASSRGLVVSVLNNNMYIFETFICLGLMFSFYFMYKWRGKHDKKDNILA